MDFAEAKEAVNDLLEELSSKDKQKFKQWIQNEAFTASTSCSSSNGGCSKSAAKVPKLTEDMGCEDKWQIFQAIRIDLLYKLPPECILDTETIHNPQDPSVCGDNFDTVAHVDAFIYDDNDLDLAVSEGKLSRSYCGQCGSKDIRDLDFISHSFSVDQVRFISQHLLRDYRNKKLLDIGSRTGALLYGVGLFSGACVSHSVGVELNKEFVDLSESLIQKYNLSSRVSMVCDDILNCSKHIQQADIVVMHNVFEFFSDKDQQIKLWKFCLDEIKQKPGRVLISYPAVEESLSRLDMEYDMGWLVPQNIDQHVSEYKARLEGQSGADDLDVDLLSGISVYTVS